MHRRAPQPVQTRGEGLVDDILANIPALAGNAVEQAVTAAAVGTKAAPYVGPALAVGKMAYDRIGGFNGARNAFQNTLKMMGKANPKARPLYEGEKHAVEGPTSAYPGSQYSFMGPGTHVVQRIARGDPPINQSDRVAMRHDIAYLTAKNPEEVRRADIAAIEGFKQSPDDKYVTRMAIGAMKTKIALEDRGLLDPMRYIGDKSQAAGAGAPTYPGQNLVELAEEIARKRRREKRKSRKT